MARVQGKFTLDTNYELSVRKPFDARTLVPSYEDLLLESNWLNDSGKSIAYNGLVVAVANTSDTTNNGVYYLFDPQCTTSLKSPKVTLPENWHKLCDFSEITSLQNRLTEVENLVKDLEPSDGESYVKSANTRKNLPATGEENVVYIIVDENAQYRWSNELQDYVCVGRDYTEISTINGGTASI